MYFNQLLQDGKSMWDIMFLGYLVFLIPWAFMIVYLSPWQRITRQSPIILALFNQHDTTFSGVLGYINLLFVRDIGQEPILKSTNIVLLFVFCLLNFVKVWSSYYFVHWKNKTKRSSSISTSYISYYWVIFK